MKKFELKPIKDSYLNYILEIWVDGVNISQFYENDKIRIDVECEIIFETIDNIKEKYFYWLKDDYEHNEDDKTDEEIEQIISISEPFYEW